MRQCNFCEAQLPSAPGWNASVSPRASDASVSVSPRINWQTPRSRLGLGLEGLVHIPVNPALKSLHWLKIKQRIDYKILSLTYNVLTTTQPSYLHNLISVQPHRSTRSSDIINLSRPPSSSSLKVDNRSFRHASPCLWNQLPK